MKSGILFLLVCVVFIHICESRAQSHNVSWGTYSPSAAHLKRQVIFQKSRLLLKARDDFTFEQKDTPWPKTISQVVVTDQYTNGKGGYATLTGGGPGMHFVKLHFTSQRGHGFNFIIDIYGH